MADWRQIQARIRKARTGPDAREKMTALYERSRDAMVAFELAKLHEQAGENSTAIEWYQVSADRFRRNDWRSRAEEAITRLGGTPTPHLEPDDTSETSHAAQGMHEATAHDEEPITASPIEEVTKAPVAASQEPVVAEVAPRKHSRRGRRGGRRRKKPSAVQTPAPPPQKAVAPPRESRREAQSSGGKPARGARVEMPRPVREPAEWGPIRLPESVEDAEAASSEVVQRLPHPSRAGDPGLASRIAKLDSMLRRLLASTPRALSEAESAPAGPGVFLVSDAELTSYYYVEQCATLRIAVKLVLQGTRGRDQERSVKSRLAEHLKISETQATRYMKDHCVARWLQIDEGASHLSHYAIAVLQPALNE